MVATYNAVYLLLEGMELIHVDFSAGVCQIGFGIKKQIAELDKETFFMNIDRTKGVEEFRIGDRKGYWYHTVGSTAWYYHAF